MRRPTDAYREGYEKGRRSNLVDNVGDAMFGMLRDDPGGHYAAGYHDGATGKAFRPPPDSIRKEAADLNPFDDKVAVKTVCPNCGAVDWFEWKFLGKLTDPVCGFTWYVGSGTYALMQLRAAFGAGQRFSKYLTSGVSGDGAWIGKALGWCMGTMLGIGARLEFGILMIPIQAIVGLCHSSRRTSGITSRSAVVALSILALGFAAYEIRSGAQSGLAQAASVIPVPSDRGGFAQPAQTPSRVPAQEIQSSVPPSVQNLLPSEAKVIEWSDVSSAAERPRIVVLWMLSPQPQVRNAEFVGGCSDWVLGDYWFGPTRLSLIDAGAHSIINTVEIRAEDDPTSSTDTFNIPFRVSNKYYYVPNLGAKDEGQPVILSWRNFTNDGSLTFPLFYYEACGITATSAFGYSKQSDRVMQYAVEVQRNQDSPTQQFWVAQIFSQTPSTPGHWEFSWYPGHGSEVSIQEDVSYDAGAQRFVVRSNATKVGER